ncbi:MAG: hypothetical protein M1823_005192 [Watsoniomyces obsoletus]|nr:MAG: hypothetical protein M1823_005192 [Watsoniomyces obsoletus]
MDLDAPVPLQSFGAIPQTNATILCYNCGAPIDGTTSAGALCYDCVKLTVDITDGVQREAVLQICRDCDRWLQPPNQWIVAALESRELLALCLRKLRGLSKLRVIDASFIWTEPHSRRIKVKITIQQEAFQGTILQQTFEVEYVVGYQQCPDCAKSYTANTWRAVVQVRQKVSHKRTFLYLEQLILKQGAHRDTLNIKETKDGLDFFFSQRNHAEKFVDFLSSVAPVRSKKSQELISTDVHSSTKSYKFTFSVELIPICKDDLVALPIKLAQSIGSITPLVLCYRVGTSINVMDPNTLQTADISSPIYWRTPFGGLADVRELVEFIVMDIEPIGPSKGRFVLAEATVARASDMGSNDTTYLVRTHLGGVLHPGDSVLGYHLVGTNFNNPHLEALEKSNLYAQQIPDVVLVRKHYVRNKKKTKTRNWRLKRLGREMDVDGDVHGNGREERGNQRSRRQGDQDTGERDYEMFLRDIEEDQELRSTLALYKASQQKKGKTMGDRMEGIEGAEEGTVTEHGGDDDDEEGLPPIAMEELLDEFDELHLEDRGGD